MSFVPPHEGFVRKAFRLTLERIQPLAEMGLLDEEGLTASVLGGVSTTAPLLEQLAQWEAEAMAIHSTPPAGHGVASPAEQPAVRPVDPLVSWGTYRKSGGAKDPTSETATGGDFALVIWESSQEARLAIFQAKKGTVYKAGHKWTLNIRRGPTKTSKGFTQFVMLFANALRCSQARLNQDTFTIAKSFKAIAVSELEESVKPIGWVHYLAYMDGTFVCVPLGACASALSDELTVEGTSKTIEISTKSPAFQEVVDAGFNGKNTMWLSISREHLEALLPSLLHLMPVHAVDEKGTGGLILGTVEGTAFFVSRASGSRCSPTALK